MKIKIIGNGYMPQRAYKTDAGLDLRTPKDFVIKAGSYAFVDTGVCVELPKGTTGFLKSKSGLNKNHNIIGEGVIDENYRGSIGVKLYNLGFNDYTFKRGDKIIQLVILPVVIPEELERVDELDETDRGENGFGSSGR